LSIPKGFENFYPSNYVLLLLKTLYGTKQAALQFWRKLVEALTGKGYNKSRADACLYFAWNKVGLVLWLSWVDDCLIFCGRKEGVLEAKKLLEVFEM
jgi:hypothetical protein